MSVRRATALLSTLLAAIAGASCFGAVADRRSYYVLAGDPADAPPEPAIHGLLRVSDLNADAAYEKYQIVVRRSPFELRYSDLNVWAVKPNQMVSDIIAKTLLETGAFTGVTRTLGELRPDYNLSGDLHALEVYDSDDVWFAHLAFSLQLNRFRDGTKIWSFSYDQRKPVPSKTFAHAVRALSELLSAAVRQATTELIDLERKSEALRGAKPRAPALPAEPAPEAAPEADSPREPEPIYVPEKPR